MSTAQTSPTPSQSLAELASTRAGASRVFQRHNLDFCCAGQVSLAEACRTRDLDEQELLREIVAEARPDDEVIDWSARALPELVEHILTRFHAAHREEVPRLIAMAEKVESVHAQKASCPSGLAAHLRYMEQELEHHMQKEEQVLFPMIVAGHGAQAEMPVQVMEQEHKDHGANLARMRELAHGFEPPSEACGTWRALYLGVRELEAELMKHIHLENHVLFPLALRS